MAQNSKYPFFPPYDSDVTILDISTLRINPSGANKMAKFCYNCNMPIHVRIILKPCNHYICYECYKRHSHFCGLCGSLICEIKRPGDRQKLFSCDNECYRVFQAEQQLNNHMQKHKLLKK